MPNLNKVMLMGHLGKDPEIKFTPGGLAVCNFSLAISERVKKDGEWGKQTLWVNITAFGKTAEVIEKYTGRGDPLFIEGRLRVDNWEDSNGNKRSKTSVVAEKVEFLKSKKNDTKNEQEQDVPF